MAASARSIPNRQPRAHAVVLRNLQGLSSAISHLEVEITVAHLSSSRDETTESTYAETLLGKSVISGGWCHPHFPHLCQTTVLGESDFAQPDLVDGQCHRYAVGPS